MLNPFLSSLLLGAVFVAGAMPRAVAPPEQLEMSYELKESAITLHEPVVLLFKVHNGLEQPITLDLGVNWVQFFEFALTSSQGQVIQGRSQSSEGLSTQPGKLVIGPGEDHQQVLLLNQWFDLDLSGKYLLTARLSTRIDVGRVSTPAPQAQRLLLEIRPRDSNRLTKVCADLARRVEEASNAEAAQDPALTLSYIEDPIAVPYLTEVLSSHKLTHHSAIVGLERIGNDGAIKVLLSALNDKFSDIADLARQALTRMEDHISNPALKETVRRALAPTPSD